MPGPRVEYTKSWRKKNPEKVKAYREKYRAITPEHTRESAKKWAKENYIRRQGYNLKRMYGISGADFKTMLEAQNGLCAICHRPEDKIVNNKVISLSVDHAHINSDGSGPVRGLLCHRCNTALGIIREEPEIARNMAEYLEFHKRRIEGLI